MQSKRVYCQAQPIERPNWLERIGGNLAEFSQRWFPDAYVFALIAVVIVIVAALMLGRTPYQIGVDFGSHFWDLMIFTMQMVFVLITGYVVAVARPVHKIIDAIACIPKTSKGATAFIAFFAMVTSMVSWGFSLIFSGFLIKAISNKIPVDFRAVGAAGYLGLGSVWALGLSSSAALLMTSKGSIPPALYKISGIIPLEYTIFHWQNGVIAVVLIVLSCGICYFSAPTGERIKTAESAGITYGSLEIVEDKAKTPGEYLEHSVILTAVIVIISLFFIVDVLMKKGPMAALDLNLYNFIFLVLGMILHKTPHAFLKACAKSIPACGGLIIQFPMYAGIFGILMGSGLNDVLMHFFVSISTQDTLAPIVGIYSAFLGLLLPSGGAKWIVEAPYVLQAAQQLQVSQGWMVTVYNAAEALPNFINPFLMLPLMGVMGVKARDLAGFSFLQLIFHAPLVIFLLWLLGLTMPYIPPIMQ